MEIPLNGFKLSKGYEESSTIKKLNNGEYVEIIESAFFWDLFRTLKPCKDSNLEKEQNHLKSCSAYADKPLEMLAAGMAPLILFIQKNWTGPNVSLNDTQIHDFQSRKNILKELVGDGENVVSSVESPELLYISNIILESAYSAFKELLIIKIWYLRYLFIHQQILEELSPNLFDKINSVINEIKPSLDSLSKSIVSALHLEFARIFIYYQNIQKSKEEVQIATKVSGIEMSLSGALGKRTKFQIEDLAQLTLKVNIDDGNILEEPDEEICKSPKDIKLDDEVRLDKIKFVDSSSNDCPNLTGLQQAVVLGNLFQAEKSQPKDGLADEELQPLINCILDRPKVWSVKKSALLLRSKLEKNHKRTVERSMMQLQMLVDDIRDANVSLVQKSKYFFVSHLPPKWEIQLIFASVLASLGSIKSALEIYLSLEDWENVIGCYNALQMRHKAQEIIEQELNKNPTPKLWCLLGDATDDVSCYEKAWELSNRRSARSQRHWALFCYYRQNYSESINHFQKSLEINSLQKEMWYKLGFAALMSEKWEISATAYRRYVVLDPECFEAWNNLARCYCELKQNERAWRALQEALKVNYSNWKVWNNYMMVSSHLKMFDDVIKSYHEILNVKEKHLDKAVLNSLIVAFQNFEGDENDKENSDLKNKFRSKLLALFGRITSQIINDADLWFLYSEVVDTDSTENLTKKHQLLVKAHRSAVNKTGWEKKLETCNRVVYVLSKLVEVGLLIRKPDVLMSCKFAANGALVQIKKEYPDAVLSEKLEKNLEKLEKELLA